MTDTPKPTRAVASNVNLAFFDGLLSIQVDLLPVKESAATDFHLACPICDEPSSVQQRYICSTNPDHGPFEANECHHSMKVEGALRKVTEEQVEAAKTPLLPKGTAEFHLYPALQVSQTTLPGGSIYRLRPRVSVPVYSMLVDLLSDLSVAAICELTNRDTQKMYRCVVRDNALILMELVRPDEIREPEQITLEEYPDHMLDLTRELVATQIREFDPSTYHNGVKARVAELSAALLDPTTPPPQLAKPKTRDDTSDLMAILQASVAKAAKAPAKRAPKKVAPKKTTAKAPAKRTPRKTK
jgi:hypothetical protein